MQFLSYSQHICCQSICDPLLTKSSSQEKMKLENHSDILVGDKVKKVCSSREDGVNLKEWIFYKSSQVDLNYFCALSFGD